MALSLPVLLSPLCVLLATLVAVVWLRRLAPALGLLDHPGGRKHHECSTPVVGGIAMAGALLLTWLIVPQARPDPAWLAGFAAFVVLGAVDDRLHLQAGSKFLFQAFVAAAVVVASGLGLPGLGEVLPGWSPLLGVIAIPFSVFAIVSVMNAVNMSDGVDGLAGSLALSALLSLALACGLEGRSDLVVLAVLPAAALVGFLVFNLRGLDGQPARIFMGDAGSLGIGFLVAVVALKAASGDPAPVPPAVVLWSCFIPLADGLCVILVRIGCRSGAMSAGRDHLHHLLLSHGHSPGRVVAIEAGAALGLAVAAVAGWRVGLPEWVLVAAFAGAYVVFHLTVRRAWASLAASVGSLRSTAPPPAESAEALERGGA